MTAPRSNIHAMTVDVEDYHNVIARDWLDQSFAPTRAVVENTEKMLAMFERHGARATFFLLGEVAETYPSLVTRISSGGHELGVHGYYHRQLFKLTPDEFRTEVSDAKKRIEDISGRAVRGHRAPAFSIGPATAWGLDILVECGFEYDSSIFPVRGSRYGWPQFPPDIHRTRTPGGASIIEAPLTTVSFLGRRWPACGGGYLRHFPKAYTMWAMKRVSRERPVIVYLHPAEVELGVGPCDTSRLPADRARIAQRVHRGQLRNRHTVAPKVESLLQIYQFTTLEEVIAAVLGPIEAGRPAG